MKDQASLIVAIIIISSEIRPLLGLGLLQITPHEKSTLAPINQLTNSKMETTPLILYQRKARPTAICSPMFINGKHAPKFLDPSFCAAVNLTQSADLGRLLLLTRLHYSIA